MTPTIYALVWLIIKQGAGGVTAIPMPSAQLCEQNRAAIETAMTHTQCIYGQYPVAGAK